LFPGADSREFWQRSEERNKKTARVFDALGLQEYEALEVFVGYDELKLYMWENDDWLFIVCFWRYGNIMISLC